MTEDKGAKSFNRWAPDYIKRQKDKVRRERIATACLQGLLGGAVVYEKGVKPRIVYLQSAEDAVTYADALIAELDKKETP